MPMPYPRPLAGFLAAVMIGLSGCAHLTSESAQSKDTSALMAKLDNADAALARGDWDDARQAYQAVVDTAPALVSPHFGLGVIAYRQGELTAARRHFRAVIERDRGHVLATHNLAMVNLEAARRQLKRHEALAPVSAARPGLMAVRRALEALGRAAPATAD